MIPTPDSPDPDAPPTPASPGSDSADTIDLPGVIRLLRTAGGAMLVQIGLYGALARVEWEQERRRLLGMIMTAMLGMASLIGLQLFAGTLALILVWDTAYRLPVAAMLVVLNALAFALAWVRLRALSRRSVQSFAATRNELAADLAAIKAVL